jgi:hypothetical protein
MDVAFPIARSTKHYFAKFSLSDSIVSIRLRAHKSVAEAESRASAVENSRINFKRNADTFGEEQEIVSTITGVSTLLSGGNSRQNGRLALPDVWLPIQHCSGHLATLSFFWTIVQYGI